MSKNNPHQYEELQQTFSKTSRVEEIIQSTGMGSINTWDTVVSEGLKRVRHQLESSLLFFFSKI